MHAGFAAFNLMSRSQQRGGSKTENNESCVFSVSSYVIEKSKLLHYSHARYILFCVSGMYSRDIIDCFLPGHNLFFWGSV